MPRIRPRYGSRSARKRSYARQLGPLSLVCGASASTRCRCASRTAVVERVSGRFRVKREIVWQYRETRGWQVQIARHPEYPSESNPARSGIAVTDDGAVYHDEYQFTSHRPWPTELGLRRAPLTDPISVAGEGGDLRATIDSIGQPWRYTIEQVPRMAAEARKAMAEFLVSHGG